MFIHQFIVFFLHVDNTEKIVVVDEDFSSSQSDFVVQVAGAGQSVVSISYSGKQLEKTETNAQKEDRAASPEQVRFGKEWFIFPCLQRKPQQLILVEQINMWMRSGSVSPFELAPALILKSSLSEKLRSMFPSKLIRGCQNL